MDVGASYWVRMGVVVESKLSGGASGKECLPMQEMHKTWVWSLGQEDPLEEEMASHSSILAWKIPRTEEPDGL